MLLPKKTKFRKYQRGRRRGYSKGQTNVQAGDFASMTTVTGLPSTPSRKVMRQPQASRPCVNPFSISGSSYHARPPRHVGTPRPRFL